MSQPVELVALQMTSVPEPNKNLVWVEQTLASLSLSSQAIVVLPECFACFGAGDKAQLACTAPESSQAITDRLSAIAKSNNIHLFAGTTPVASKSASKFNAACRYFDNAGIEQAVYNKIHLFDVDVSDTTGSYRESATTHPGNEVVVVSVNGLKVGIAVCYDVRFPGLFDAMGDVDVIVLPSAFTKNTGEAHWETLVRARAIEKQCFIIAANQSGVHENGRETYGHSMIVSPWGDVLALQESAPGSITATVEVSQLAAIKKAMPVSQHAMFRSHFVK